MSRGIAIGCLVLAACGRIGFATQLDGDARGDGAGDGGELPSGTAVLVKASNPDAGDEFGHSVAVSGDGSTIAIGAPLEASAATTINGNEADNSAPEAGAVYVLRRTDSGWAQEAYVKSANSEQGDQFGWSVALSNDGNTLVVGARREDAAITDVNNPPDNNAMSSGAAYVFVRAGTTWSQQAYIKPSNTDASDSFGERVAISGDGTTLAVGAPFEDSFANGVNGVQTNNQAVDSGAVYVLVRSGTTWTQQAYVKPFDTDAGDQFGYKLGLSGTGDVLVVGAYREDSATAASGADNSAASAGAAYVLTRAGSTWAPAAYLKAPSIDAGDNFGYGVGVSADGTRIAIAAEGESSASSGVGGNPADNSMLASGALYVFAGNGATWSLDGYIKATNPDPDDQLGFGLALSGSGTVLVGGSAWESSANEMTPSDNSLMHSGAVYTYVDSGGWMPRAYDKANNPGLDDAFGWACALSATGTTLVVGAPYEDSSTNGIDAVPNEGASNSGAVYIFD